MKKKPVRVKKKRDPAQKTKKTNKKSITRTSSEVKVEKILIENFVALQKVMTNLSIKFNNLATQISKLLELFEISAKALAEKDFSLEKETNENKKIIEKIDNLLEQNKIIARGLTLLHEPVFDRGNYIPTQRPMQRSPFPISKPAEKQSTRSIREYQKSTPPGDLLDTSTTSTSASHKTKFRQEN